MRAAEIRKMASGFQSQQFKMIEHEVGPVIVALVEIAEAAQAVLSVEAGSDGIQRMKLNQALGHLEELNPPRLWP